jgi:tetratricopeptide (TPR) repeat protein
MMFRTIFLAGSAAAALGAASAHAQMSITTIGATDAVSCYQNAEDDLSRDTGPCDKALKEGNLTPLDKKKTLVNRGIIHNRNGDIQDAIDDFNTALDIDSSLAEAFLNRGNSYFLSGQHDAALSDYDQALALGLSKPWLAWYNIGLAYEAKKDTAKAREAYQKALDLNPGFTQAQMKLDALGED